MEHAILSPTKELEPNASVEDESCLVCEWGTCRVSFSEMRGFVQHTNEHLITVVDDEPEAFCCVWCDCVFEATSFDELFRHVLFHAYHVKVKCVGTIILRRAGLECKLDTTGRNLLPELPDKFLCSWKDCQDTFDDPNSFYHHVNEHVEMYPKGNPRGGLTCLWDDCSGNYQNHRRLRDHLRSHSQEKTTACATCGSLFANKTKLVDHVKRQIPINKEYKCSHCNKSFSSERLLRDHTRVHVNHYKCPYCDMTCPTPSSLSTHVKYRHSEEKPFLCHQCEYTCKARHDLVRHMDSHNPKPLFKCTQADCDYSTRCAKSFQVHNKKMHSDEAIPRYMCHICEGCFSRGTYLTHHLMKKHKFRRPSGHSRFRYKCDEDGYFRLQTVRFESIELTHAMMDSQNDEDSASASQSNDSTADATEHMPPDDTLPDGDITDCTSAECYNIDPTSLDGNVIELPIILDEADGPFVVSIQQEDGSVVMQTL